MALPALTPAGQHRPPTVTLCRGCCCGTERKHPDVDHDGQLRTLGELLTGTATVRTAECLDICDQSNVVVVQPSSAGRAAGGRPVWLGHVLDDLALRHISSWVHDGGPGVTRMPAALAAHAIERPGPRGNRPASGAYRRPSSLP